jgi:protein SMG7
MQTTFSDLNFAHDNNVEEKLWQAHSLINSEYRKAIKGIRTNPKNQVVLLRKVDKQYSDYLKTAEYFYRGFIERLSAKYRLPKLQRIANRMQATAVKVVDDVDATSDSLEARVTVSCANTLMHLGDISRYRSRQARAKGQSPKLEKALTFYQLAHEMNPTNGQPHHQMAITLADEKKDFDIVYHFYRSWASKFPHEAVANNLASEFQKITSSPPQNRPGVAADPQHTFASWFVRLHARYFKGEVFASQDELEREVLHRLDILLSNPDSLPVLQKSMLINIAAYHVAMKSARGKTCIP